MSVHHNPAHHGHSGGGVLSTLLMTAPLLVVPALAAIGLSPVAGDEADGGGAGGEFALETPRDGQDGAPGTAADPADLFAEVDGDGRDAPLFAAVHDASGGFDGGAGGGGAFADSGEAPPAGRSFFDTPAPVRTASADDAPLFPVTEEPRAPAANGVGGNQPRAAGGEPLIETAGRAGGSSATAIPALTARLTAAGATDITLAGGDVPGSYYAGCSLRTDTAPRVVRRFEAEAATPADAVRDVLGQVARYRAAADHAELTSAAL